MNFVQINVICVTFIQLLYFIPFKGRENGRHTHRKEGKQHSQMRRRRKQHHSKKVGKQYHHEKRQEKAAPPKLGNQHHRKKGGWDGKTTHMESEKQPHPKGAGTERVYHHFTFTLPHLTVFLHEMIDTNLSAFLSFHTIQENAQRPHHQKGGGGEGSTIPKKVGDAAPPKRRMEKQHPGDNPQGGATGIPPLSPLPFPFTFTPHLFTFLPVYLFHLFTTFLLFTLLPFDLLPLPSTLYLFTLLPFLNFSQFYI